MEAVRALPVRPCKTRVLASDGSTNAALEVSRARAFQALRHRDFRLLFTGQAVSLVGDAAFLIPLVVDRAHLPSANSLMGVARWGGFVVGPALAGFLYHGAGSAWVFAIDALSFLVSGALMLLARPRAVDVEPSVGTLTEIREGATYVARIPWLWVTITLFAVILMLQLAPQQVLLPKLVKDHFDRGVGAYAALSAMVGIGTVCGTLLFGHLQPRRRRGVISYWLWLINSLAIAGLALAPWYLLAGGLALVRGVCIGFGVAVWETMLQELVPARLLGRVISLDFFGSFGLMPIGLAIWGAIAGIAPPGPMIAVGALVSAAMITVMLTRPWLRAVE